MVSFSIFYWAVLSSVTAARNVVSVMDPGQGKQLLIGVISDTHGLMRPEALMALEGASLLIHAGDIGRPEVIVALGSIASVVAVRGNIDRGEWAHYLAESEVVRVGKAKIFVLHNANEIGLDPAAAGIAAVISGHSHCPMVTKRDGVLYVNPGSAGPRRFTLPVSVARLWVKGRSVEAEIVELNV